MKSYAGGDPGKGAKASEKLDGVYARATKDGVFSRSGKPLDVPHVQKRLKRHFRKHPEGELEGELWRKREGVEKISGAVRAGGEAAKKLRLHVFPRDGQKTPLPFGAVRRVKARKAETAAEVEKVFRRALKRGQEGIVLRGTDGVALKKKPREDAEYEVVKAEMLKAEKLKGRGVFTVKDGERTFRVQGRPGVAAQAGERLQVSYSGKTAKGKPKAAVAERVRNDTDFEVNAEMLRTEKLKQDMKTQRFETPARGILGDTYARVLEFARGASVEEEIARDRQALKRVAIGSALAGGVVGTVIGAGKRRNPLRVKARKLVKAGVVTKGEVSFDRTYGTDGTYFEEKRDALSQVRDVAIIGGAGAAGAGGLVAAHQARKLGKKAGDALGYASSSVARTAKQVRETVTPESVARAGGKLVKRKVKDTAKRHFPTFIKAGKALKRTLRFETPARRLGIEFAVATVDRSKVRDEAKRYVDHWDVATGRKKGYTADGREAKVGMADPAVVKSLLRKANTVNKWGTRGGGLAKDAADVVRGKPRARDASGRKRKREWEKGWAKDAAKKALLVGGGIAYGIGLKKSPKLRGIHDGVVSKAKRTGDGIKDAISNFETPARRILGDGLFGVADRTYGTYAFARKKDDSGAVRAGVTGAAVGGANGAVFGGISAAHSKAADGYFDLLKDREVKGGGGVAVLKREAKPFKEKGKFGAGERVARARHETLKKAERQVKRTVRNRSIKGGLAGAALLGGLSYVAAKAGGGKREAGGGKRRNFETPAQRILAFDENAAEAGWDVRDPRGRSARVFAPGSRRRVRREKKWHEEVENERKLWKAGVLGAGLAGGAAGVVLAGGKKPKLPGVGKAKIPLTARVLRASRKVFKKG